MNALSRRRVRGNNDTSRGASFVVTARKTEAADRLLRNGSSVFASTSGQKFPDDLPA